MFTMLMYFCELEEDLVIRHSQGAIREDTSRTSQVCRDFLINITSVGGYGGNNSSEIVSYMRMNFCYLLLHGIRPETLVLYSGICSTHTLRHGIDFMFLCR